ncbi:DNA repair protein RadA [Candidatus Roizmanbacteria bacterium]|nr:DNA repair protein RadA [Candidatus Roizmanbacteria bacterium]
MAQFVCSNCGYGAGSWYGKCPGCGEWNTFTQFNPEAGASTERKQEKVQKLTPTSLAQIPSLNKDRKSTGIFEFDRVLGGGFVAGEVILLTGEPGIGKSTLLLQSLQNLKTLYISGEEAGEQIKERAVRLGVKLDNLLFADTLQLEGILDGLDSLKSTIEMVVIDSIQTIYSKQIEGQPGSVSQLKEVTNRLIIFAKQNKLPMMLVGHVTKDGDIAGPKTVEHMVDAVLAFEGEKVSHFRILRAQKNRFGSTDEIGIFAMEQEGLVQIDNPLAFLDDQSQTVPGKAIIGVMEGKRPLFFEIQALAAPTVLAIPRRVVNGVDYNKVLLLLAVIRKNLHLPLDKFDIYINVIGGVNVKSTAADLGITAATISSIENIPLPPSSLFIGEVGLLGEIRKVFGEDKVIKEAKRLTFKNIYSSSAIKHIRDLKKTASAFSSH